MFFAMRLFYEFSNVVIRNTTPSTFIQNLLQIKPPGRSGQHLSREKTMKTKTAPGKKTNNPPIKPKPNPTQPSHKTRQGGRAAPRAQGRSAGEGRTLFRESHHPNGNGTGEPCWRARHRLGTDAPWLPAVSKDSELCGTQWLLLSRHNSSRTPRHHHVPSAPVCLNQKSAVCGRACGQTARQRSAAHVTFRAPERSTASPGGQAAHVWKQHQATALMGKASPSARQRNIVPCVALGT